MKYALSFCEIEQLSDDIFEVTINEGAIIDDTCAEEAEIFWRDLRTEPYSLFVNNKNQFSYSFIGSQNIGEHSLEKKTAILIDDGMSKDQISMVLDIKQMDNSVQNRRVFNDREEAIKWLNLP